MQCLCFSSTMKKLAILSKMFVFRRSISNAKKWVNGLSSNPKNFGVKIKSHEKTQEQLDASITFGRWQAGQRIDRVHKQAIATDPTSWRKFLLRILNIVMNLATISLALRGHWEHTVGNGECFLELVAMQPRFDPVLQDLTFTENPGSNSEVPSIWARISKTSVYPN